MRDLDKGEEREEKRGERGEGGEGDTLLHQWGKEDSPSGFKARIGNHDEGVVTCVALTS